MVSQSKSFVGYCFVEKVYNVEMFLFCFSLVRLRIKSFRVPELFVEIPETATVGSLKVQYPNLAVLKILIKNLPFFFMLGLSADGDGSSDNHTG